MNDVLCGIMIVGTSFFVLSQSTHLTDRQTARQTDRKALQCRALYYMQSHGKNGQHIGFRQCFCRRNNYCVSENQSQQHARHACLETSRRRNRVVVESSPSGCEPPRQIVWKRAV